MDRAARPLFRFRQQPWELPRDPLASLPLSSVLWPLSSSPASRQASPPRVLLEPAALALLPLAVQAFQVVLRASSLSLALAWPVPGLLASLAPAPQALPESASPVWPVAWWPAASFDLLAGPRNSRWPAEAGPSAHASLELPLRSRALVRQLLLNA